MSFLIKYDQLLEKCNQVQEKVKSVKKGFDSETVSLYLMREKINENFYCDEIPKEGCQCICLLVILIDSFFRVSKNYDPQVLLEECKYVIKEKNDASVYY